MKRKSILKLLLLAFVCLFATGMVTANVYAAECSGICQDEQPGEYYRDGPYRTSDYSLPRANTPAATTVFYPTNADSQLLGGIVFCPPFTIQRSGFRAWGPWFASHGIVLVTMNTRSSMDSVDSRSRQQEEVLNALKKENTRSGSPLQGKLDTSRIGAMGWSMGGGATWINSGNYSGLKTAMSLAGHNMTAVNASSKGGRTKCPTMIFNGATDLTILGGLGQSTGVYRAIPNGIPKAIYEVSTAGHFAWGSPTAASTSVATLALAFQKTFLYDDLRWAQYIKRPSRAVATWNSANIPN